MCIYITEEVKDICNENYKTLKNEVEEDTKRWKDIQCLWFGRVNIVKIITQSEAIYKFNAMSIKNPMLFSRK
jgi:hypothetical protein